MYVSCLTQQLISNILMQMVMRNRFKRWTTRKTNHLLAAKGIGAAIDDGLLDIPFRVLGFETRFVDNMGNVIPEVSAGADFSQRQKEVIRTLNRGKFFNITRVRVIGPDGIERTLPYALEVTVN